MSGFVMVPAWFRRKKPSAAAMLTYVTLAGYGRFDTETATYEECRPSVETLAEACGMAQATVKRALAELYGLGAVERRSVVEKGKGKRPSVYRVIFGSVEGPAPALTLPDGLDMSHRDGSDLSHGFTSGNANLSHGPMAHTDGSNSDGSDLSHEEEVTPSTHNQEQEEINPGGEPERDDFSPGFLTVASGGVLSGTTDSPTAEFGRRVRTTTEEIMSAWQAWIGRTLPSIVVVEVSKIVRRCVADGVERNAIAFGLKEWTEAGMIAPKYRLEPAIAGVVSRGVQRPADRPSPAQQRAARTVETARWAAGKTADDMARDLEAALAAQVAMGRQAAIGGRP